MELPEEIMVLSKFTKFWQISSCLPHYPYRNSVHFHTFGSSQYPVILQRRKILKSTMKLTKTTKSSLKCCLTMMMNLIRMWQARTVMYFSITAPVIWKQVPPHKRKCKHQHHSQPLTKLERRYLYFYWILFRYLTKALSNCLILWIIKVKF